MQHAAIAAGALLFRLNATYCCAQDTVTRTETAVVYGRNDFIKIPARCSCNQQKLFPTTSDHKRDLVHDTPHHCETCNTRVPRRVDLPLRSEARRVLEHVWV